MRRIFILFFCLPFYLVSISDSGVRVKSANNINWITIWLSFFFGVLFTMLFRFLNNKSKPVDQRSYAGLPLSGWVLFLGINLIFRVGIQIYFFWSANYFLNSTWIHLEQAGGASYHSLFIFEMFLSLFSLTGTGALIYWFFGRRDIFPTLFIYYVGFYLLATLVLLVIYNNIKLPPDLVGIRHNSSIQFFRIIYSAAWAGFVWRSARVKQTFVYPF